jgi:hypothetical protein
MRQQVSLVVCRLLQQSSGGGCGLEYHAFPAEQLQGGCLDIEGPLLGGCDMILLSYTILTCQRLLYLW